MTRFFQKADLADGGGVPNAAARAIPAVIPEGMIIQPPLEDVRRDDYAMMALRDLIPAEAVNTTAKPWDRRGRITLGQPVDIVGRRKPEDVSAGGQNDLLR